MFRRDTADEVIRLVPRTRKDYRSPVDEKTIGSRLRELRKRRGMTQLEVAEELGVRQALISQYEQGTIRMHGALIAALAKLLGASADEILGLDAVKPNGHVTDRRFLRRLERIRKLSRRDQQVLLRSLDAFLKGAGVV